MRNVEIGPGRYWLFAGAEYYPVGGMLDYEGSFDTLGAAWEGFAKRNEGFVFTWAHVLDVEERKIVWSWTEADDE